MELYLIRMECGSIQNYIFASNRLKEAIGGSYLVKQATETFVHKALERVCPGRFETHWASTSGQASPLLITEQPEVEAEILYTGGGNALVLTQKRSTAVELVKTLGSILLGRAPGLTLFAAISAFNPAESGSLGQAMQAAQSRLENLKEQTSPGMRLEGLGITRPCATTGRAATIAYRETYNEQQTVQYLSGGAAAKREAALQAAARASQDFPFVLQHGYRFPSDLDELGGREGNRHMAVVHIDGNQLGLRLQAIIRQTQLSIKEHAAMLRSFAAAVNLAAEQAFAATLNDLIISLPSLVGQDSHLVLGESPRGEKFLPLRPLVYGGDDLTFVCEGRLGLELAARYLEYFSQYSLPGLELDGSSVALSACAGVVVARNHFPLARAYRLSEELCRSAKHASREDGEEGSGWLDFHIIYSGSAGRLSQARRSPALYRRPWRVTAVKGTAVDGRSWEVFEALTGALEKWPRSRAKGLREVLVDGLAATLRYLEQAALRGNRLAAGSPENETAPVNNYLANLEGNGGWDGSVTPLHDAIEALDFYLPLSNTAKRENYALSN